jgi:PilZ domain
MKLKSPEAPMDKERRKSPRSASHLVVDLYDSKGHAVTAEGQFLNISEHGAMIETPKPLKIKDKIRLRVQPGKDLLLELIGQIVWVVKKRHDFIYGVRFAENFQKN